MDGINNPNMEAEIIMPLAKPKITLFAFVEIFLLRKNTNEDPKVVAINIIDNEIIDTVTALIS